MTYSIPFISHTDTEGKYFFVYARSLRGKPFLSNWFPTREKAMAWKYENLGNVMSEIIPSDVKDRATVVQRLRSVRLGELSKDGTQLDKATERMQLKVPGSNSNNSNNKKGEE